MRDSSCLSVMRVFIIFCFEVNLGIGYLGEFSDCLVGFLDEFKNGLLFVPHRVACVSVAFHGRRECLGQC